MPPTTTRTRVLQPYVIQAMRRLQNNLELRLQEYGQGTFASSHEIYGILAEEHAEYLDAIRNHEGKERQVHELMDIAVAAVYGAACTEAEGMDWL